MRFGAPETTRVGLFGGTFDPPHVGHLLAATDALEQLGLDQVIWIPAARQPLKDGQEITAPHHRIAMVRAAIAGIPAFSIDTLEVERGGLSYTVDTLRTLHERWRGSAPLALFLLLGTDAASTLPKWREPGEIARLCEVVVLTRGEEPVTAAWPGRIQKLVTRRVEVSSTEIRARMRAGLSIGVFVPEAVAAYMETAGLYR